MSDGVLGTHTVAIGPAADRARTRPRRLQRLDELTRGRPRPALSSADRLFADAAGAVERLPALR